MKFFRRHKKQIRTFFQKTCQRTSKRSCLRHSYTTKDGHSKMDILKYTKIKLQDYMKSPSLRMEEALNIFKFRDYVCCPFGSKDENRIKELDNQAHRFQCSTIKREIEIKGDLSEVYSDNISKEMAQTITKIINIRGKKC